MNINEKNWGWRFPLQQRASTTAIILHHSAGSGTAESIHAYHQQGEGWSGIGYHYYIRRDGSIWRGRPEDAVGCHAGVANAYSIGVCFEGNFENETMCDAQKNAGSELVADILSRRGELEILRHKEVCATACPGRNFPFDEIVSAAKESVLHYTLRGWLRDNDAGQWSAEARQWAADSGIFVGAGEKNGEPNYMWEDFLTREQLAVVLYKFKASVEEMLAKAGLESR